MKKKKLLLRVIKFSLILLIGFMLLFFAAPKSWSPQIGKISGASASEKLGSLADMMSAKPENKDFLHIAFIDYDGQTEAWYFSILVMKRYDQVFSQESKFLQLFQEAAKTLFVDAAKIIPPQSGDKMVVKIIFEDTQEIVYYTESVSGIRANPADLSLYLKWSQEESKEPAK